MNKITPKNFKDNRQVKAAIRKGINLGEFITVGKINYQKVYSSEDIHTNPKFTILTHSLDENDSAPLKFDVYYNPFTGKQLFIDYKRIWIEYDRAAYIWEDNPELTLNMKYLKPKEISVSQWNKWKTINQMNKWKMQRSEIKYRKKMLDLSLKNIDDALNFKNTKLTTTNLVDTLNKIKSLSKKNQPIKKEQLKKTTKYNDKELNELIERLKMLGEIYDPYLETKKQGQYLKLI